MENIYEKTRLRRWPDREHIRENVDRFAHPWRRGSMLLSLGLRRKCIIKHHVILFLIRARMFTWSFTFPFSFPLLSLSRYGLYIPLSSPVFLSSVFNPLFVCSYIYIDFPLFIFIYMLILCDFLFCFYFLLFRIWEKLGLGGSSSLGEGGGFRFSGCRNPPLPQREFA